MPRSPIPTSFFALVVVQKGDRFLLVQERKHDQSWYLPAGRVEAGETLVAAAVRETLEESGIAIQCAGVLRIEHSPNFSSSRMRVFFLAHPIDDRSPKSVPDAESLGAAWLSLAEMIRLPLRSPEVVEVCRYVQAGGLCHPLSVLSYEGAVW